ncbi:padR family transcriptional regulator [Planomonospora sphaerica]|uniref:PadR family transcriptional regulator n=1 Tax=Planomonospora sphaerica TaxID=161355 RepID=A0A171DLB5_9ACTN|nr:PadR family transcriptional regulator [Planomonospora sphaerica]GAT69652.1 padR family transcriptional regulator [Planomonospora sphaerica]
MARRSQTETAVLGALSMHPMTAYALREAIRDVLGHFWSESFGQIYPTLGALEQQGHVERREGPRSGSSTFAITDSGTARLRELLSEPIAATPPRSGLLLRLFFGRTLGVRKCRELLLEARADAERSLAEYDRLARTISAEEAGSPDLPYVLTTISAGRHNAEAAIAWADEALALLEDVPGDDPPADGPPANGDS